MPPKDGLQEHTPIFEREGVISAVLAPDRAAALEASVPAWPPPMTTTSYGALREMKVNESFRRNWPEAYLESLIAVANCLFNITRIDRARGV